MFFTYDDNGGTILHSRFNRVCFLKRSKNLYQIMGYIWMIFHTLLCIWMQIVAVKHFSTLFCIIHIWIYHHCMWKCNYYFSISLACLKWKRKNQYTCVYIMGKLVGLIRTHLKKSSMLIHYLMLGKPKYQLTSKHNEIKSSFKSIFFVD